MTDPSGDEAFVQAAVTHMPPETEDPNPPPSDASPEEKEQYLKDLKEYHDEMLAVVERTPSISGDLL